MGDKLDPHVRIASRAVIEAVRDLRRPFNKRFTPFDRQTAIEFLRGDIAALTIRILGADDDLEHILGETSCQSWE
jgi:hypothetical protein